MGLKGKRNLLIMCSLIVQILPLILAFALNWDNYVRARGDGAKVSMGMSLSVGGILCAVLIGLQLIGKLPKAGHGIVVTTVIFIIICLLEPLLRDAKLLVGMYLLGKVLDAVLFAYPIKRIRRRIAMKEQGKETTEQVKEVLEEMLKNGREK